MFKVNNKGDSPNVLIPFELKNMGIFDTKKKTRTHTVQT